MEMLTFNEFINSVFSDNLMLICVILTLCVVFVNGWTDAPNAIATCVCTRCISIYSAIIMSAVFNLLGVLVMSLINISVAETISSMVVLSADSKLSFVTLSAALFSVVAFGVVAWVFSIPTSESHALIAGLTGSTIALNNGINGINLTEWLKVIIGLFISLFLGVLLGYFICKLVVVIFKNISRQKGEAFFKNAGIGSAALTSFMHGAQDGQKFMGVIMLVLLLKKDTSPNNYNVPLWMIILIAVVISLGTLSGGKKIIKSVGSDMVPLQKFQGFSSDIACALSLAFCSMFGLPVSTTHVKTAAIVGVGAAVSKSTIKFSVFRNMLFAWGFTFPCCVLLSYLVSKLFILSV